MSNDQHAENHDKSHNDDETKPVPKRKPIHINDIRAEARKKTKTAAEAEGMSIERFEEVEKALTEEGNCDFTDEERHTVERIHESLEAEALAQVQSAFSKPWMQTYTANRSLQNALASQTSGIMRNFANIVASQNSWKAIQSAFASNLSQNLIAGMTVQPETWRAVQNFTAPTQELLNSWKSVMGSIGQLQGTLQANARAALIPDFATKTQEFLTTDIGLRYRRNHSVWHYTNGHALLSILKNGQLWASNPENLNDSSEMKHGFEIIRKAFLERRDEMREYEPADWENMVTVLSEVLDDTYSQSIINDVYYISASTDRDSLTLWRNYADGDGFALGINAKVELSADGIPIGETTHDEPIRDDVPLISGWYRVSYRVSEKQKLAQEFIHNAMEDIGNTPEQELPDLVQELRKQAVILASVMKHEAFKDEKEVRWITTNFRVSDPVHYEHGRRSIVPVLHVKTSAQGSTPNLLPLNGLRCSPVLDAGMVRTMQGFLRQQGYDRASQNVEVSQQPFKG